MNIAWEFHSISTLGSLLKGKSIKTRVGYLEGSYESIDCDAVK